VPAQGSAGSDLDVLARDTSQERQQPERELGGKADRSRCRSIANDEVARAAAEEQYGHGQLGAISRMNATAPMSARASVLGATTNPCKHQPQAPQLAVSMTGVSSSTATVSPRRGATRRTRMVPRPNPNRNTIKK
jgi:hypothetical protein